jgi:hypothetical protein
MTGPVRNALRWLTRITRPPREQRMHRQFGVGSALRVRRVEST